MNLPIVIQKILTKIEENNYQAYVVGGAVRNSILGIDITDYDITTSARPEAIIDIFSDYKKSLNGLKHGTVGIVYEGVYVEITTFRKDEDYFDHRHPKSITFVNDLKIDLSRRDFTINAIAYNKEYFDYFKGIIDIKNKIIRTVGNPYERFDEDGLRILRALRFSSVLDFEIEEKTSIAIKEMKELILYSSKERIYVELKKMIVGKNFALVFEKFFDVIEIILPFVSLIKNKYLDQIIKRMPKEEGDFAFRMAILFHYYFLSVNEKIVFDSKKDEEVNNILSSIRCPKKISQEIKKIILLSYINIPHDEYTIRKLLGIYKKETIFKAIDLHEMSINDKNNIKKYIEKNAKKCNNIKDLNINGDDLLELKVNSKKIQDVLAFLLDEVIMNKVNNEKEELKQAVLKERKNDGNN